MFLLSILRTKCDIRKKGLLFPLVLKEYHLYVSLMT